MVRADEVLHVAKLARLAVPADEVSGVADQLGRVLEYMELLGDIEEDAPDGAPEVSPGPAGVPGTDVEGALRPDEPGEVLEREAVLGDARHSDGETFFVPPVLEGGGKA